MRALVTGGAGFVGNHLVEALVARGDEALRYDKVTGGDIFDALALTHALSRCEINVVYHFAASAEPHGGKNKPTIDLEQNLLATSTLLKAMQATGVPRIVFASSSSVYGDCQMFPTPEDAPMSNQTSLYGASKMAAEGLISAYCRTFNMQYTIFRFAPMLGEGYRRGHVRDFYDKLRADPSRIDIYGNGKQQRSYVYVKDAMAAVLNPHLEKWNSGTFNVAGDDAVSVDQSLDWICDELGVNPERVYTGASWAGDKPLTMLDTSRIRKLGWMPQVSVEEAVRRTVRSFE